MYAQRLLSIDPQNHSFLHKLNLNDKTFDHYAVL